MSRKNDNDRSDLPTEIVDKVTGEITVAPVNNWVPPQLDKFGREIVSPISLVAAVDLRPMSLGERIRRYQRTPQFQEDLKALEESEIDDEIMELYDDGENPISPYEDRFQDLRERIRQRKRAEEEAAIEADRKREADEREAWRQRHREILAESSTPFPATPPSPPAEQ